MIKKLLDWLVESLLYLQYRYWQQEDHSFDILATHVVENDNVNSIHGYSPITGIHLKKRYYMIKITLEDDTVSEMADKHLIFTKDKKPVEVDTLKVGDEIITKRGIREITDIEAMGKRFTYDMTVANENNCYFTDDILSHNSVMSAIYIVWYVLSNKDKTVAILSQNQDKVVDLMEKIKMILSHLPFYMKPGLIKNDMMTLHLDNGCKISGKTTTENSAAGITANLLYMDEFALISNTFINKFYRTAFPTISADKTARVIITSTARGMNKFWEIYDGAVKGKNFYNPIRVDWWEVEGRDEQWRLDEIANIGSEEDFNQEYGNQFIAGASLIFRADIMQKLKKLRHEYVPREMDFLTDKLGIAYEDYSEWLTWHPKFDIDSIQNEDARFVVTIDLADGDGGDYIIYNFHKILPMTKKEVENVTIFSSEKDFYKLVQIGLLRANRIPIPEAAQIFYHLLADLFIPDHIKAVCEMNFDGKRFVEHVTNVYGENNELDVDYTFVKFKHQINAIIPKTGLKMSEPVKNDLCSAIKDKVKYNQLIPTEKVTIEESFNFSKTEGKKGSYKAQSGHDDAFMTEIHATAFFDTMDFQEMIEDLLDYAPKEFIKDLETKLEISLDHDSEGDNYGDLL